MAVTSTAGDVSTPVTQKLIEVHRLDFDPQNPRFPAEVAAGPTDELIERFVRDERLLEVIESIANQGYFAGEPLLVVPQGKRYIVLEGNRRLAALKLLSRELSPPEGRISIETAIEDAGNRPSQVPCLVFDNRQEILSLPKASDVYLWCDFIELRCLVHPDKRFSRQDFIEVVDDTRSAGVAVAVANDSSYSDDDESGVELNGDGAASEDGVDEQQSLPASDKSEALAADLYGNLMVRKAVFADAYPFELSSSGQEIRLSTSLTPPQILYLELLLSSSLRFIPKTRRKELTDPFESLSTKIFSALMPNGWEVHQFGAQTGTRYRGHLATRMDALAKDWRGKHLIPHSDYRTHNAGDGGLDIVAWHPMGDEREGVPIAAAQCGCTATEWQLKQLEASPALLGGKLWALHPWATYYFMPQDLLKSRNGSSEWQRRNLLGQSIVVDRLRIVRLARQYGIDAGFIAPSNAVTEARSMAVA